MALKTGDICYSVQWTGTRIEYCEHVLRTIRTRKHLTYGYWWCKIPGVTWGKLSKTHGDYGWLPGAWPGFRRKHPIDRGRPYAASKLGALRDEIADLRVTIARYGADEPYDEDGGPTLGDQLKAALAAQKRMRKSK
ncbi:hypothetical protein D2T29_12705 [Sinirhodobacter populi]|uniref:Uncharacterized protein n=1 Tax=Paenirhodobacter populi TaxID=2306993 RepID=A0A443KCR4_9RHOB|nr:hypothetical protein [Sinirhodobacter populi]RWR30525.1 hypothetical protein D2T29_12705 [Sinirhodobacter populi]